ncbi:MAG: hypothetical protein ACYCT7_03870 [bacterium]
MNNLKFLTISKKTMRVFHFSFPIFLLSAIFLSITFTNNAYANRLFLPGLWQFSYKATISGLPYPIPPISSTYTSCIGNKLKMPLKKTPNMPINCPRPIITMKGKTAVMRFECSMLNNGMRSVIKELMFESFPTDITSHIYGHIFQTAYVQGRTINNNTNINATGKRVGVCGGK